MHRSIGQVCWTALASWRKTPTGFSGLTGVIPVFWNCTGCSYASVCFGMAWYPPSRQGSPCTPTKWCRGKQPYLRSPRHWELGGGQCSEHRPRSAHGGHNIASGAACSPGDCAWPWWPWWWWGTYISPATTAGLSLGTQGECRQRLGDRGGCCRGPASSGADAPLTGTCCAVVMEVSSAAG